MNNVLTALCGTVNFMPPWIMLGVFGAIILLIVLILAFKGGKKLFFRLLIYTFVAIIVLAYAGWLCYQIALWDVLEIIAFAIGWGPTILFGIGVLIAVLRGIRRGLRKSLILALHAACAGAVCVAFFFIAVYVKEVDAGALKFVNWLCGENALQNMLGVPESCSTLKEVLAAYIASFLGEGMQGLTPYIYTLVDMSYRITFGLLSVILFFFIDFILYIVYILCYSQRKYKKNKMLEFKNGKTDRSYKKHWIGGGVVGLFRGIATGLLCLSFVGSAFFVVAGGKGEGKLEDHDFGNEDINLIYEIYRSVESYGAQGIFKVLNAMTDAADTPYYLFAADLVFSGELNDEEFGISENVKFREEFAAFTGFARDTLNLLIKYGPDEINAIIGGEASDNAFDTVLEVMTRHGFKEEFDSLIDAFDSQTYIINLSMSLVNTIVSHIDEIEFTKDAVGDGEKELIKLIFKKGFLTENIPDERDLMTATGKTEAEGKDIRPYLTVKHILNKSDIKLVLNIVFSILAGDETGDTLQLVKRIVPEISNLSILSTEKKAEFNPVLARMYCLFENLYLTADGEDGATYTEMAQDGIDWVGEIHTLLDAVDDTMLLYANLAGGEEDEERGALDILKELFDETDANYQENMKAYDNLCSLLTDSRVLGRALSTNFVYKTISEALKGIKENIYIPENIVFNNTLDDNGKTVYGETYRLLYGVKLMFGKNSDVIDTLLNMGDDSAIEDLLNVLADAVEKTDDNGESLAVYLTESVILRSVISIQLIEVGGNTFYVPKAALETVEEEPVNLITKTELKGLLENMTKLVEFVMPFVGESTDWVDEIDKFLLEDEDFYRLVETNRIFEGTVAQLFNEKLKGNSGSSETTSVITIPKAIDGNIDGWITIDGKRGELLNLLDALRYTNFSIAGIIIGGEDNEFDSASVLKKISSMNEDELEKFFSSSVLHYTVSGYVLEKGAKVGKDFVLIIPENTRQYLEDDNLKCLVKKSELVSVFGEISKLGLYGENVSVEKILIKIARDKSLLEGSKIIPASIVATIVNNESIAKDLIPELYDKDHMGSKTELENYDSTNPWTKELPALIEALDEIFGLSARADEEEGESGEDGEDESVGEGEEGESTGEGETTGEGESTGEGETSGEGEEGGSEENGEEKEEFSFEGKDIGKEVSGLLPKLNEKADIDVNAGVENPRTKLRVLYDSAIFRNKITNEVDKALTEDIIDGFVINHVKLDGYYKFEELQSLSESAKALGITSLNEEFTQDNVKGKLTTDNLDTVYGSTIIKGIVTKSLQNAINGNSKISDHPLAYETNLKVYKQCEIESILVVCEDLDGSKINLGKVSKYVYADGVTKSYILVASITDQIIDHPGIIIPDTVVETVEGKQYINAEELSLAVNAFVKYGIDDFDKVTDEAAISIPEQSLRKDIFKSEIVRARITYRLVELNRVNSGVLAVKEGNAKVVRDVRETNSVGYVSVATAEQLEYLASALEILYEGDTEFKVPEITSAQQILNHQNDLDDVLLKSDIVHYRICEYLATEGANYGINLDTEDAFDLDKKEMISGVSTASADQIIAAAQTLARFS